MGNRWPLGDPTATAAEDEPDAERTAAVGRGGRAR